MDTLNLLGIFSVALAAGFGHCIGMCGGIVVAYTTGKIDPAWSRAKGLLAHLMYNAGRVVTYALLGAFFGMLGSVVKATPAFRGILMLGLGIFMLALGLAYLGKLPFLTWIESRLGQTRWYRTLFTRLLRSPHLGSFFGLGLLNGLLPCGLVYFFAASAAATASVTQGALVMAVFGIATVPALFSVGILSHLLSSGRFRNAMMRFAAFLIILYALFTLFKGYMLLADPQMLMQMMGMQGHTPMP